MSKFVVFKNDGGLACKIVENGRTVSYIASEREFQKLLNSFMKRGYTVKVRDGDMGLIGDDHTIILKSCYNIIDDPMLKELAIDIERTIDQNGYYDISKRKEIAKKANRAKSNSNLPKIIKIGLEIAVGIGALLAIYNAISEHNDKKIESKEPVIPPPIEQNDDSFSLSTDTVQVAYATDESLRTDNTFTDTVSNRAYEDPYKETPSTSNLLYREDVYPTDVATAYLDFENNSQSDKAKTAKELYMPYFEDCAYRFGLDDNLLLAIGTQERGVHSDVKDPLGGIGLMQVQYDVWINKTVSYLERNLTTGEFEKKSITITDAMLKDLKSNIEVGSIILQTYLKIAKYNIPVAIQMYNMGDGALKSILRTYGSTCGKTLDEVLDDPMDLGWTEYRYLKIGDKKYLEKVNQWAENPTYRVLNLDTQEPVSFAFTNDQTLEHTI